LYIKIDKVMALGILMGVPIGIALFMIFITWHWNKD